MYLGDGFLARHRRDVYRLRISLDSGYPGIVASCAAAMEQVMPDNRVQVIKHPVHNCVEVGCYSKHWPCFFPQHGAGLKHNRWIMLEPWQASILEDNLNSLLRGLIHSDGCRALNKVNGTIYPRYQFSNRSEDIRAIFSGACDELGIHWTQSNRWTISVSRRADVARMDSFIGPKA